MAAYDYPTLFGLLYIATGSVLHPFQDLIQRAGDIQDYRGWGLDIHRGLTKRLWGICPLPFLLHIPGQVKADKDTSFRQFFLKFLGKLLKIRLLYGRIRNIGKGKNFAEPAQENIYSFALVVESIGFPIEGPFEQGPQVALEK
jgi:hypothetical protein